MNDANHLLLLLRNVRLEARSDFQIRFLFFLASLRSFPVLSRHSLAASSSYIERFASTASPESECTLKHNNLLVRSLQNEVASDWIGQHLLGHVLMRQEDKERQWEVENGKKGRVLIHAEHDNDGAKQ